MLGMDALVVISDLDPEKEVGTFFIINFSCLPFVPLGVRHLVVTSFILVGSVMTTMKIIS